MRIGFGAAGVAAVLLMTTVAAVGQTAGGHRDPAGFSNSATLAKARELRAKLSAAGFDNIVNLQEREGGAWSCRALRSGTTVRVGIDRDGKISIL